MGPKDRDLKDRGLVERVARLGHRDLQTLICAFSVAKKAISGDSILKDYNLCSLNRSSREIVVTVRSVNNNMAREIAIMVEGVMIYSIISGSKGS